jgi:hypothetical protein
MKKIKFKINNSELIEYKKKMLARKIATKFIKLGKLERSKNCHLCNAEKFTEAHHTDYGRPIDVMWLCDSCHGLAHREDSVYNPKNVYQTPIPLLWEGNENITISFTVPAKIFIAIKKISQIEKTCVSKIIRKCVQEFYQVEENQLTFNFEEENELIERV